MKLKPLQFSLRGMFWIFSLFAIWLMVTLAIIRGCENANTEIMRSAAQKTRALYFEAYKKNMALLESSKDKLSPEFYQQQIKETEKEWKKRQVEFPED
jgi:hypothetical protein